jgi:hypothetical protein
VRAVSFVAAAIAVVFGGLVVGPSAASAGPVVVEASIDTPGPRGGIAVVGDSVMLGSAYDASISPGWGPSLTQLLSDRGWGPVRMRAGGGFQAGRMLPPVAVGANLSVWLTDQFATGFDPSVVVVSLGANDIGMCSGQLDCAVADIRFLVDAVGPARKVWWALQTTAHPVEQATWNDALQIVAAERTNVTLWDWPAVLATTGIVLADNVHLPGPAAYLARSIMIADDVTDRMGVSEHVGGEVVPPAAGPSYEYQPVVPSRMVDTRETGLRLGAGGVLTVDFSALAPAAVNVDAGAVALNITAADPAAAGYLTVWPCATARPSTSSVNFGVGQARGAQAISRLGPGRTVCVFASAATDVIVDLQGVFTPAGGLRFSPLAPARVLDTRFIGRAPTIAVPAPAGAAAVAATLTVTGAAAAGFLSAYPCSAARPDVSNVNWQAGETVAGAVFVPVGVDGTLCVYTSVPVDVIVDVTGMFGAVAALRFVPVAATRMLDTRTGIGGWWGRQGAGQTIEIGVAPDTAVAVTGTITMVEPSIAGYLTGTVCRVGDVTSSVNAARNTVMANSLTVGLGPGGSMCIHSVVATHTLFDTTGWWVS